MTDKEQFDLAREIIRHEDGLINNRVTWLLVLQGFLFTAFVNGIGLYGKAKDQHRAMTCTTIGLVLIGLLGIVSSLTALNVVRIAFRRMQRVEKWWKELGHHDNFPALTGEFPKGRYYFLFSTGRMPFVFVGAWSALILLLLIGVL